MRLVWVKYSKCRNIELFKINECNPEIGEIWVLESSRGLELGRILSRPLEIDSLDGSEVPVILRKAQEEDLESYRKNLEDEKKAYDIAKVKIAEHNLPMKLVEVEYMLDRKKLFFYFTSEDRIDFRALVRDLAAIFKTRIEMRQIGVRDEVKILGGLGPCGWPVCCLGFLRKFESISIRMAKEQNLVLNPAKISGVCGRLLCCLLYEYPVYKELWNGLPPVGSKVITPDGEKGEIVGINLSDRRLIVEVDGGRFLSFHANELKVKEKGGPPKDELVEEVQGDILLKEDR
ncbi:MAG: stage 0 sporulation family protein [Synergistetes bacterium]|nr:stage 0 sporulation family protein [Synergistota bacterium]MDW8193103.1 stage 0 sporulation family protein [Synergistota bacterium]